MTERRYTSIPFPGFYESDYDHAFDRDTEQAAENEAERNPDVADWIAEHLAEFASYTDENTRTICEMHLSTFAQEFKSLVGVDLGLEFESMTSPREYNFSTDRLFAYFDESAMAEVWHKVKDSDALAEVIEDRHTSRSGFASFYTNDAEEWRERDVSEFDHNELETVLLAAVKQALADRTEGGRISYGCDTLDEWTRDIEEIVTEYASGNGYFDCVDWPAFEAAMEAEREARAAAEGLEWFQIPLRCDQTPDMFGHWR